MEGNLPWDFENGSNYGKLEQWKFELRDAFCKGLTRNFDGA